MCIRDRTNIELKRHVRIHTGAKPYSCRHCSERFARLDQLKTHLLKSHSVRKSRGCRFKSDRSLVDVGELIGSNVESIPLMYPLSYAYYSVYRTLIPLFVITKDTMGMSWISSGHF